MVPRTRFELAYLCRFLFLSSLCLAIPPFRHTFTNIKPCLNNFAHNNENLFTHYHDNFNLMKLLITISILFYSSQILSVAQEGSESAAEASVTGSASQPVLNAPDTSDSNPIVSIVRLGVPINSALQISLTSVLTLAQSSADITDFNTAISSVAKGSDIDSISTALQAGLSVDNAVNVVENDRDLDSVVAAISAGLSFDDAIAQIDSGSTLEELTALASYSSLFELTTNSDLITSINAVISAKSDSYSADNLQIALTEAVKTAEVLLTDQVIVDSVPSPISSDVFTTGSGYNYELVRLLVEYGAIGDKGSTLASSLLGTDYAAFTGTGSLTAASSTSDYLSYLSTLTGSATFGDIDSASSILDVPMSNIYLSAGSNITLGATDTSSEISVSSTLTPSGGLDSLRKVLVVGAAKDLTVLGDVKFTNESNKAEDNALVVGAADNVMISNANLSYDGANLGIGSGDQTSDSMWLVNTTINAGGNLAVGSLGTLNISSAEFLVGQANQATSDPDNVYLYANDLIQANGLSFSGANLDDVYMEAITLNLSNIAFPSNSDVMLRSRDGSLFFDTYSSPVVGGVNMTNVKHGTTTLALDHFDGISGHHDSSILLPNGTPAVKIRKQY